MAEHYFTKKPTSKLEKKRIKINILGAEIELNTATGVFSKEKIDLGTRILIENSKITPDAKVLDLGCGYGVVGITIAKIYPQTQVVMTDVNERATKLTTENAKLNNVNTEIRTGNEYETVANEKFDYILLNPPQKAGRDICYLLIEKSIEHLNSSGALYLVARHQRGGRMLEQKMKETFGNVKTIARESGFRVYASVKK